jgi:hypothetical protein
MDGVRERRGSARPVSRFCVPVPLGLCLCLCPTASAVRVRVRIHTKAGSARPGSRSEPSESLSESLQQTPNRRRRRRRQASPPPSAAAVRRRRGRLGLEDSEYDESRALPQTRAAPLTHPTPSLRRRDARPAAGAGRSASLAPTGEEGRSWGPPPPPTDGVRERVTEPELLPGGAGAAAGF